MTPLDLFSLYMCVCVCVYVSLCLVCVCLVYMYVCVHVCVCVYLACVWRASYRGRWPWNFPPPQRKFSPLPKKSEFVIIIINGSSEQNSFLNVNQSTILLFFVWKSLELQSLQLKAQGLNGNSYEPTISQILLCIWVLMSFICVAERSFNWCCSNWKDEDYVKKFKCFWKNSRIPLKFNSGQSSSY